jgi:lipopolysaccharide export LptBFGC system permease protein LptF
LVISFQYILLVVVGQAIFGEDMPKWIGVWFPNMLYFLVAVLLLRIAPK